MWRDYSSGYIRNNRSSGVSVMIAALISALLLSLLSGFLCRDDERADSSVRHFFQHRSHAEADTLLPAAGGGCPVLCAGSGRESARDSRQYGTVADDECPSGERCAGQARGGIWIPPARFRADAACYGHHDMDICVASGEEAWQADASGGNQKHRGAAAFTKEELPDPCAAVRRRGRAGRQRAEGTAKGTADSVAVSCTFLSGLYADAVLFHPLRDQHAGNVF